MAPRAAKKTPAKRKTSNLGKKSTSPPVKAAPKKKATPQKPAKASAEAATPDAAASALVGKSAPSFTLPDQDGNSWSSDQLKGKPYVLYFYPKDDTPGCTKEACGVRDHYAEFRAKGVPIFGVSADTVASHRKFADKYNLPFPLLADPDRKVIEAYGAWREKSMYGRTYMGIQRMTVIVGPNGKIVKEWPKVSPEEHAAEILREL